MMKKLIYTIGFLMFASVLIKPVAEFGALAYAQSGSGDSLYSKDEPAVLESKFFSSILPDFMSDNIFEGFGETDIDDVGVDLYAKILKKTIVDPEEETTKNIAAKYALTTAELGAVRRGDYQTLLNRKPTLSQNELLEKVSQIQRQYDEERELAQVEAEIEVSTMPSEIFMNGDLSDSGFDLLYDLTMIEKLLFLKTSEFTIGADYNASGGGSAGSGGGAGSEGSMDEGGSVGVGGSSGSGGDVVAPGLGGGVARKPASPVMSPDGNEDTSVGPSDDGEPTENGDVSDGTLGGAEFPDDNKLQDDFNPNLCFSDNEIKSSIEDFVDQNGLTPPGYVGKALTAKSGSLLVGGSESTLMSGSLPYGAVDASASGTAYSDGQSGGGASGGGATGATASALTDSQDEDDFFSADDSPLPPARSAPRDNWKKERVCNDTFCLYINFYNDPPDSQFQDSDNCLACHVEKINDALKETLNSSLMPNKMTGNLIEVPKCKSAMSAALTALSMNVTVQFMPILTPLNDELILASDAGFDWQTYCEASAFFPADSCKVEKTPEDIIEEPENIFDRITEKELAMQSDVTLNEISERISVASQLIEEEAREALEKLNAERASNANVMLFNAIEREMDKMNLYFENYRKILKSFHEEVPGLSGLQPCTELKNKKVCT